MIYLIKTSILEKMSKTMKPPKILHPHPVKYSASCFHKHSSSSTIHRNINKIDFVYDHNLLNTWFSNENKILNNYVVLLYTYTYIYIYIYFCNKLIEETPRHRNLIFGICESFGYGSTNF